MAEESRARFRHEDIAAVPKGWRVRTVTHDGSGHRVRVAFPPGRKQKGSGRLISILHPTSGQNPCANPCTLRSANPAELMVMSANPPRARKSQMKPLAAYGRGFADATNDRKARKLPKWLAQFQDEYAKGYALGEQRRQNPTANPAPELLVMGANPAVAANPIAAELYEQFHGREPRWETIDAEPHMPKGDYAKLGDLVGLTVKPVGGGQVQTIQWFHGSYDIENYSQSLLPLIDAPWVVSNEAGQIYFYKGNQDISRDGHELATAFYDPKAAARERARGDGIFELGEARIIRYRARKSHDNEELLDYVHRFGEESGIRP